MRTIVSNLDVEHLVVSFSNEGYIERDDMVEILETRGKSIGRRERLQTLRRCHDWHPLS